MKTIKVYEIDDIVWVSNIPVYRGILLGKIDYTGPVKIKAIDLVISTGGFMRSENKSKYQIYIPLYNHTMWVKSERVEHLIE